MISSVPSMEMRARLRYASSRPVIFASCERVCVPLARPVAELESARANGLKSSRHYSLLP